VSSHLFSTHNQARPPSEKTRMPQVFEKAFSLPFGHWSSSGGFPAGSMRSRCVPDQVRQGLALSDIKGWRPECQATHSLHITKHAPHQRGPGCQVFEKAFSLPFGHRSSSGGFPAGAMRSRCVPDQVRQALAFSDIKGWRPEYEATNTPHAFLMRSIQRLRSICVPCNPPVKCEALS
jgi:hypothetical protein